MKKTCLTLLAALAICLSANAQKVYTGALIFYIDKSHEIFVDNAKTIAEKKAGKKYILSVFKKCLGDNFLKAIEDDIYENNGEYFIVSNADYHLAYIYKNKASDWVYPDFKWLKSKVKPQYLKKGNLILYCSTPQFKAERDAYLAIYNTKTGKVYLQDEMHK